MRMALLAPAGRPVGPVSVGAVRDVEIRDGTIRLGQFLKLTGIADSGSDARRILEAGHVQVNDEPEERRGRQLRPGDVVSAMGNTVRVSTSDPSSATPPPAPS